MPSEACEPRVEELRARISEVDMRMDGLKVELEDDLWVPDFEEVTMMADELQDLATLQSKGLPKFKDLLWVVLPTATG